MLSARSSTVRVGRVARGEEGYVVDWLYDVQRCLFVYSFIAPCQCVLGTDYATWAVRGGGGGEGGRGKGGRGRTKPDRVLRLMLLFRGCRTGQQRAKCISAKDLLGKSER